MLQAGEHPDSLQSQASVHVSSRCNRGKPVNRRSTRPFEVLQVGGRLTGRRPHFTNAVCFVDWLSGPVQFRITEGRLPVAKFSLFTVVISYCN